MVRVRARIRIRHVHTTSVRVFCFSHGDSRAKYNLTEPVPLQLDQVAVEFVVEPFR